MCEINHFKVSTIQDYVTDDIVLIWQLVDNVTVDHVDILYIKKWLIVGNRNISIVDSL
jgi:hypothetical protein